MIIGSKRNNKDKMNDKLLSGHILSLALSYDNKYLVNIY